MNAMLVVIVGIAILIVGYIFYGGWLAKQWGVDDSKVTPAHELEDGMDYVPAKAPVLMGPHQRRHPGRCLWLGSCGAVGSDRRYLLRRCP